MYEVAIQNSIPKQTFNLTQLLEMNPIEVANNVNDLVNIIRTTVETYNSTSLFVVYFIGKTMDDTLLSGKYPGLTVTKLAKASGMSIDKASRYHRVAKCLKPEEVYDLRKIPYKCILQFPQIAEQFGEQKLKEIKFRLITNDWEGVKSGTDLFNKVVEEVAHASLGLDSSLPAVGTEEQTPLVSVVPEAEVTEVVNPCETVEDNGEDADEHDMLAVDKILADRNKETKEALSDDGSKSKSENQRKSSIALAQSKRAVQKVVAPMKKVAAEAQPVMEALWQYEDFIIGDPVNDATYRGMMSDVTDALVASTEAHLKLLHEFHRHGFAIRKIEIPEGATAESLLDPAH